MLMVRVEKNSGLPEEGAKSAAVPSGTPDAERVTWLVKSGLANTVTWVVADSPWITEPVAGDTVAIMAVRTSPMIESFRTSVNLLWRKGRWAASKSRARMHSFKASRLLLISEPSSLVRRSTSARSAPRSLPAKSMKERRPYIISDAGEGGEDGGMERLE